MHPISVRRLLNILALMLPVLAMPMLAAGQLTTTKVHLTLSAEAARPGDTVMAAIRLQMQPQWHTYWRNAGDAGIPTTVDWALPPGSPPGRFCGRCRRNSPLRR